MLQIPESKIAVPALPDPFVLRPGLLAALGGDGPTDERVTLVCAPRGYGKTALLAHWARVAGRTGPSPAWVNLDSGDNDPRRLWTGILAALTAHPAVSADGRLRELARTVPSVGDRAGRRSWRTSRTRSTGWRCVSRWSCATSTKWRPRPPCGGSRRSWPPARGAPHRAVQPT